MGTEEEDLREKEKARQADFRRVVKQLKGKDVQGKLEAIQTCIEDTGFLLQVRTQLSTL